MHRRCYDMNHKSYKNYGGRGIFVCDDWQNLNKFKMDLIQMGWEHGLTLDRIDNDKGYCLDNIRLATRKQQSNNKRNNVVIEYKGRKMNLTQWCEFLNLDYGRIQKRWKAMGIKDPNVLFDPNKLSTKDEKGRFKRK